MNTFDLYLKINGLSCQQEKWDCNILSQLSSLIKDYNDDVLGDPGENYRTLITGYFSIKELLMEDFFHLEKFNVELNPLRDTILIEEALQDIHNASVIYASQDISENYALYIPAKINQVLILFNAPLLHIIHMFYSSSMMLLEKSKTSNCIEKYLPESKKEMYDDFPLFKKILYELDKFYGNEKLSEKNKISYYQSPYALCEMVIATRRFIIAHELSHIILGHMSSKLRKSFIENNDTYMKFDFSMEYEADKNAFKMLLSCFADLSNPMTSIDMSNAVNGVRLFFTMLEMIEVYLNWEVDLKDRTHPFPQNRLTNIECEYLKFIISNKDSGLLNDFIVFGTMLKGLRDFLFSSHMHNLAHIIDEFPGYLKFIKRHREVFDMSRSIYDLLNPDKVRSSFASIEDKGLSEVFLIDYEHDLHVHQQTQAKEKEYDELLHRALEITNVSPLLKMQALQSIRYG